MAGVGFAWGCRSCFTLPRFFRAISSPKGGASDLILVPHAEAALTGRPARSRLAKRSVGQTTTLLARKQGAQDRYRRAGTTPLGQDGLYGRDETMIGRIYTHRVPACDKWLWLLQVMPARRPNQGIADSWEEAKAVLAKR